MWLNTTLPGPLRCVGAGSLQSHKPVASYKEILNQYPTIAIQISTSLTSGRLKVSLIGPSLSIQNLAD